MNITKTKWTFRRTSSLAMALATLFLIICLLITFWTIQGAYQTNTLADKMNLFKMGVALTISFIAMYLWIHTRHHWATQIKHEQFVKLNEKSISFQITQSGSGEIEYDWIRYVDLQYKRHRASIYEAKIVLDYLLPHDAPDSGKFHQITMDLIYLDFSYLGRGNIMLQALMELAEAIRERCPNLNDSLTHEILRHRDWLETEKQRTREWIHRYNSRF